MRKKEKGRLFRLARLLETFIFVGSAFVRLFSVFILIFLLGESVATHSQQLTEEEKRRLFLKAREEMKTIPFTPPPPESTTTPKPRPRPTAPNTTEPMAPRPTMPQPTETKPEPKPTLPTPQSPTPAPEPPVTPTQPANIRIEESAVREADEEPEPEPEKSKGWWIFGGGASYTYLTPAIRKAIDRPANSVRKGRWRYIVVHNSGTKQGNAKAFEYYHKNVRRMPNGMAYQFVIGNGTSSKDGQIEIGGRWMKQLQGGHVHSDYLNNISLGICLVGDFNKQQPTRKQQEALEELIKYLRKRVGKISGEVAIVKPHRDINGPKWPTDCPGDDFPYRWLRKF